MILRVGALILFDVDDFFGTFVCQPSFPALPFSTVIIGFRNLLAISIDQEVLIRKSLEREPNNIESRFPCKQSANDEKREMENDTSLNPICNSNVQSAIHKPLLGTPKMVPFEPTNDPHRPFIALILPQSSVTPIPRLSLGLTSLVVLPSSPGLRVNKPISLINIIFIPTAQSDRYSTLGGKPYSSHWGRMSSIPRCSQSVRPIISNVETGEMAEFDGIGSWDSWVESYDLSAFGDFAEKPWIERFRPCRHFDGRSLWVRSVGVVGFFGKRLLVSSASGFFSRFFV